VRGCSAVLQMRRRSSASYSIIKGVFGTTEIYSEASWWLAGLRSSLLKKQLVTEVNCLADCLLNGLKSCMK
jgi:hypothetical protein